MLIDSGVTNSFASIKYVRRLDKPSNKLNVKYSLPLPSGKSMNSNHIHHACMVLDDDREFYADLI